ncbi:MAG: OTU domain-containing protein [Chlamydiota bacterium]|nr:OTU domain-containing protein [Chlamydiota bacterium]
MGNLERNQYFRDSWSETDFAFCDNDRFDDEDDERELQVKNVASVCVGIFTYLSLIFVNLATIGLFTLVGCFFQSRKITALKNKNVQSKSTLRYQWVKNLYPVVREPESQNASYADPNARTVMEDKVSMNELISEGFDWAFEDILKNQPDALLNTSSKIYANGSDNVDYTYKNNMNAVYNWMVYKLIKNAGVEVACDQKTAFVRFNNYLKVGASKALHVKDDTTQKSHVFFMHDDEWSPNKEKFPHGIDPLSVKYLLDDLSETKQLETLLLQGLIPDDNARLVQALNYLEGDEITHKKVRDAFLLIEEMGRAIGDRYHSILMARWQVKANNASLSPTSPKTIKTPKREVIDLRDKKKNTLTWRKVKRIALGVIYTVGAFVINLLTFGTLTLAYSIYMNKSIKALSLSSFNDSYPEDSFFRAPKYTKKSEDPNFIQGNLSSIEKIVTDFDASASFTEIDSMDTLIQAIFSESVRELLAKADVNENNLVFNRSRKIQEQHQILGNWVDTYSENKKAVYQWMVYQLIKRASLRETEEEVYRLYFNENLSVGNSRPCEIPDEGTDQKIAFFLNNDAWTPRDETLRNGVEPVSVKWVLERIKDSPLAVQVLEGLLLSALIPQEEEIFSTINMFTAHNSEESKLVMLAYEMVSDLAVSIGYNFRDTLFLEWDDFAEDETADPILKEDGGIPFENLYKEIPWTLSDAALVYFPVDEFVKTQTLLTPIWESIHAYRINQNVSKIETLPRSDESACLRTLSQQYYWIHYNVDDSGCLFSALAVQLFQAANRRSDIDAQSIKNCMASLLENLLYHAKDDNFPKLDKQLLNSIIEEQPAWNVEDYIQWLRTGLSPEAKAVRGHFNMGDLELNIFCRTFGIGVHVFCGGDTYRLENGLMMPNKCFGPNTKEKFILFNKPGFSFYALSPRLREAREEIDSESIKSALQHNRKFWRKNHQKDWNERITM